MARAAAAGDRLQVLVVAVPHRQPALRVELRIDLRTAQIEAVLRVQVPVDVGPGGRERTVGAAEGERLRIALVLPVAEEVDPVFHDRSAHRAADLLILVREDDRLAGGVLLNEVRRVPLSAAEITAERAGKRVGSRLRDGVDHHAHRPALRGVEAVGRQLELGNRVAAVARLVLRAADRQRDRLAVHVRLEIALAILRHLARRVRARAGGEHREVHPVAAVNRNVLHLPRIDVAGDGR